MRKPIVVGVTESYEGMGAPDWAAREAVRRALPLRLVHAWEAGLPAYEGASACVGVTSSAGLSAGLSAGPEPAITQPHARQVLRSVLDRLGERYPDLDITAAQAPDPPVPALIAEAENAELLVIGGQGTTGLGGFLSGPAAMATAARIERPLAVVRGSQTAEDEHLPDHDGKPSLRTPYRDIAVAVDIDGSSHEVLEAAFRAAEARGAPLRVVHAWHLPYAHRLGDAAPYARARADAGRELAKLLEPWRDTYPAVHVKEELHEGRPAHALARATAGAGLLVVGHRAHRATGPGPHTGPVAHALIHQVRQPILLVPHAWEA
ncbi:universal stress protein [Streptomyces sp. enrichment culture]|uniref:universal stress protein n=1 Tax=Streptomyces sp. enrichment culture TaxID=1795815 RepID=UPI003F56106B